MLQLLLDENISHEIARQVKEKRSDIPIVSIHLWHGGRYLEANDREILLAASEERRTLVTYDVVSIPSLLTYLYEEGRSHEGVILVQNRTLPSHDFGQLILALIQLWDTEKDQDWTDRTVFLQGTPMELP